MLRNRLRLACSESARLKQPRVILTRNGIAASVPTDMSAIAVAWRAGRLIRSATSKPRPSPRAAAVEAAAERREEEWGVWEAKSLVALACSYTFGEGNNKVDNVCTG